MRVSDNHGEHVSRTLVLVSCPNENVYGEAYPRTDCGIEMYSAHRPGILVQV